MRLFAINSLAIGLHIGPCELSAVRLSDGCLSSLACIAGQDLITEHDVIQGSDIPRIHAKYVRLISCIHFDTNITGLDSVLYLFCMLQAFIGIGLQSFSLTSNFRVQETSIIQKSFSTMSLVDNLI